MLGSGKIADDRHHAGHEWPLGGVGDEGVLAVEESHFRRLHHVRTGIALGCLNEEVGFDVAENREAEVGGRGGRIGQTREGGHRGAAEAVLPEGDRVEVLLSHATRLSHSRAARIRQADHLRRSARIGLDSQRVGRRGTVALSGEGGHVERVADV